jgi:hypothetical protein
MLYFSAITSESKYVTLLTPNFHHTAPTADAWPKQVFAL